MRHFITLLFAAVSFLAISCEPMQTPTKEEVKFEITSDTTVNMPAEGGTFVIAYTISGNDYNNVVAEADNTEVINALNTNQNGFIIVAVTANTSYMERTASVRVTYADKSAIVRVNQAAAEGGEDNYEVVNVTANQLIGNYYGERMGAGLGHYWIIISDGGIVNGQLGADSEFFRLDLLGPLPADEQNPRIPNGTYRYDAANSLTEYTMPNLGNTDYVYVDAWGEALGYNFIEAELKVKDNDFELFARTEDKEFHVTFSGDYNITANTVSEYISTLRGDYEIDLTGCTGTLTCFGDYWDCGYCNWQIEFTHNRGMKYGTYLVLDFLTDAQLGGLSGIAGTYRSSGFSTDDPTKPAFDSYTFVPGIQISEDGVFMMGSLLQIYQDGAGVDQAPIFGGEIVITDNGNHNYTIVINATDDLETPNKITLNWTGRLY